MKNILRNGIVTAFPILFLVSALAEAPTVRFSFSSSEGYHGGPLSGQKQCTEVPESHWIVDPAGKGSAKISSAAPDWSCVTLDKPLGALETFSAEVTFQLEIRNEETQERSGPQLFVFSLRTPDKRDVQYELLFENAKFYHIGILESVSAAPFWTRSPGIPSDVDFGFEGGLGRVTLAFEISASYSPQTQLWGTELHLKNVDTGRNIATAEMKDRVGFKEWLQDDKEICFASAFFSRFGGNPESSITVEEIKVSSTPSNGNTGTKSGGR